jgi:hypothetical protein
MVELRPLVSVGKSKTSPSPSSRKQVRPPEMGVFFVPVFEQPSQASLLPVPAINLARFSSGTRVLYMSIISGTTLLVVIYY